MTRRFMPYRAVGVETAEVGANLVGEITVAAALDSLAAMGGKYARAAALWAEVEDYATGALALPSRPPPHLSWQDALLRCKSLGIVPVLIAAYSPPRVEVASLVLAEEISLGELTWSVTGSLAAVDPPFCHVQHADPTGTDYIAGQYSGKVADYGVLIDSVDAGAGTITLAAAPTETIASGTALTVRRVRYASLPDRDPDDPGVTAYLRYARFLAGRIAAAGLEGFVELWNEPPWLTDPWSSRWAMYDSPPGGLEDNRSIASILNAALLVEGLPDGVRFMSAAPNKWGGYGMVPNEWVSTPTAEQVRTSVAAESIHVYADTGPERQSWDPGEVEGDEYALADPNEYELSPEQAEDLAKIPGWEHPRLLARQNDLHAEETGERLAIYATEVGCFTTDEEKKARHITRRVVSLWGVGVPSLVFNLSESMGPPYDTGFALVDPDYTPRMAHDALARLMGLVGGLGGPGGSPRSVPTVIGVPPDERAPPMIVGVYGAQGALVFAWRTTHRQAGFWTDLVPSSLTVSIDFVIPAGGSFDEAVNVVSGAAVDVDVAGSVARFAVGEDPVAARFTWAEP